MRTRVLGLVGLLGACGPRGTHAMDASVEAMTPTCSETDVLTALPLAETDFTGLVPLGNLNPSGHTFPTAHHYFYLPNPDHDATTESVSVYAPASGRVSHVAASEHLSAVPPFTDYKVTISLCEARRVELGHVATLTAELVAALGAPEGCDEYTTGGSDFRFCRYAVSIPITAGTQIGTAGGNPGQFGLDLGVFDETITPHVFAAQARIESQARGMLYAVSLLDLYAEPTRSVLAARMSNYDGTILRTTPPLGGTIEQDVPGTAQGIWFRDGVPTVYPEDPHLALVHDNVRPERGAFGIGTSLPTARGAWLFTPSHAGNTLREFSEITPSATVYCYDLSGLTGALLLRLDAEGELLLEHAASACATSPTMTSAAVKFVR